MKRQPLVFATALVVFGMLTSCADGSTREAAPASPSGSPSAPSETTPSAPTETTPTASAASPSPSPSAATLPATILIGAEAMDIVAADGTPLVSLPYRGDGDAAVAAITEILGAPTGTEREEKTPHYPAGEATMFGGITVVVNQWDELVDEPAPNEFQPDFFVIVDSARTDSGVAIATLDGTQVGSDFDTVAAGKSDNEVYVGDQVVGDAVTIDLPESFEGILDDDIVPLSYGVIGLAEGGSDTITSLRAPEYLRSLV